MSVFSDKHQIRWYFFQTSSRYVHIFTEKHYICRYFSRKALNMSIFFRQSLDMSVFLQANTRYSSIFFKQALDMSAFLQTSTRYVGILLRQALDFSQKFAKFLISAQGNFSLFLEFFRKEFRKIDEGWSFLGPPRIDKNTPSNSSRKHVESCF